jgi:hypothetical protein
MEQQRTRPLWSKAMHDSQFKDVVLMGDFNYPNIQWSDGSGFLP